MSLVEHAPVLAIAVPLMAAFTLPIINRLGKNIRDAWIILSLGLTEYIILLLTRDVVSDGIRVYVLGAKSPGVTLPLTDFIPIRIILEVDAFSAFITTASVSIALLVAVYSLQFMRKYGSLDKYYGLLLLLTAAMIGLVFTGDLFSMFVFLELLSISSAALIAFHIHRGESLEAAFKYMVVSSVGALMVLFAVGFLYSQYNILNIAALADVIEYTFLDKVALTLLVAAFAMKCGAVPLHMWTPDAYGEAPAPISSILVVASQAALYALFRISFTLFGGLPLIEIIAWFIILLGVLSMFIGVTMAIHQSDIQRLMAYHAISQTGYMLLGIGVGLAVIQNPAALNSFGVKAMEGGIFHIINHALYKGLLFLTAGALIYRTGTKDLNGMGGLARRMPLTTIFFLIGALAIAGFPPFNGFASKLMIYESVFLFNPLLSVIAMLVSILTLASFMKVFHSAFMGPELKEYEGVREVPKTMLVAMMVLAALILLFGLLPDKIVEWLINPAAWALIDRLKYVGGVL